MNCCENSQQFIIILFYFFVVNFFAVDSNINIFIHTHTCTGRDKFTDDNIFLETDKWVNLALDSCICKNLVVSWNDAAERNDSVAREALVIPRSTGDAVAKFSTALFP